MPRDGMPDLASGLLASLAFAAIASFSTPSFAAPVFIDAHPDDGARAHERASLLAKAVHDDVDDEEVLVIDDDEDAPLIIDDGDEDDTIIIIGEDEDDPIFPRISGPLGRLWESLHFNIDGRLEQQAQLVALPDRPFRTMAAFRFDTWLLPAPNLSFYANGFARAAGDVGPTGVGFVAIADFYEAYAKINADVGSVLIGRLVVPWGRTQVAALGDRLNPPDHRRAPGAFPDAVDLRQPQWGAHVRTSFAEVTVEGVLMTLYEPTEGSLAASEQGGVRAARYQTALVRAPSRIGGAFQGPSREDLIRPLSLVDATTAGLRLRRRVGDFDVGASGVVGIDEVPTIHASRPTALALAGEILAPDRAITLACADPQLSGPGDCLEPSFLSHARTTSFTADVAWGLGLVILKGELLVQPEVGILPGKTAILVDERGLTSTQLSHYGAALALEAGLYDWVEGSIEIFNLLWTDVPAGARLLGVELLGTPVDQTRFVNRLAVGASLGGAFFDQAIDWRVRGEGGILQPDVLMSAELRYRLPILDLYVGGRGLVFGGLPGSPGWMRQDASQVAVFVGEGR
jgi:hypothetical protein